MRAHQSTILTLLLGITALGLSGCDSPSQPSAQRPAAAVHGEAAKDVGLSTLAQAADQRQPDVHTLDFEPLVQELAPGQATLSTPLIEVRVDRVTYTPYGIELDAKVKQVRSAMGGVLYLNYGDKGVLRDDAGNIYRLREDDNMLTLRQGGHGEGWNVHLRARGFLPASAKRLQLSLNINTLDTEPVMVEAHWPVPPGLANRWKAMPADRVLPGRGWEFAQPPAGNNPSGTMSVRVYGVHWLRDGIAVDLEAVNGSRDSRVALNPTNWSLALRDEKGRRYRIVRASQGPFMFGMEKDERLVGRVLFKPQIAPDTTHLTLLAGGGADEYEDRDCAGNGVVSCGFDLDLGDIPTAAMPDLPMPGKDDWRPISLAQREMPRRYPMQASRIDRVAQLKKQLRAVDSSRGTLVELPGDVLFDFDKASLRADAEPTLDKLAELIQRLDRNAHITGYTDSKGDPDYNLTLSRARAQAVRQALVSRQVKLSLLGDVRGLGEADPVAANTLPGGADNPEGRQRNRRVAVVIDQAGR